MGWMKSELTAAIGARTGAASPITEREATGDKSVTVDRTEKDVLKEAYPQMDFPRKSGVATTSSSRESRVYVHPYNNLSDYEERPVSIVYPKRTGNELRLYFSKASGFTIDSNQYNHKNTNGKNPHWYIFYRDKEEYPHIGMADWEYLSEYAEALETDSVREQEDITDLIYQNSLQNALALGKERVRTSSTRFQRNISEATAALEKADFKCEVDPTHITFTSKSSGKPYVEGHHLIPLSLQDQFTHNIDIKENIVALCPNCHRLLHHGTTEEKEGILFNLWSTRRTLLSTKKIEVDTPLFLTFYQ